MFKEILFRYNPWWEAKTEFPGIRRGSYLTELREKVEERRMVFVYGLRRVGKTYIMKQFVAEGIGDGRIGPERFLFVSVDHPAFNGIILQDIIDSYRELHGISRDEKVYVLFDEIQSRRDFQKELKAIYDLEENVYIIASGSNSLVIKHKSGELTGRNARINILPLSFDEFLEFRNITAKTSENYLQYRYLEEYMLMGGLPEYVLTGNPEYVTDMVEDIIYKDIVPRYNVRDPMLMKNLFFLLCNRVGKRLTSSKLARLLGISHETVSSYLGYFQETYLIDLVRKEGSPNEQTYAPRKVYICDLGVMNVISGNEEKGPLAENLVYLKLKARGTPRYIEQKSREIDFLVEGSAYEVKYKDEIAPEDLAYFTGIKHRNIRDRCVVAKKSGVVDGVKIVGLLDFLRE